MSAWDSWRIRPVSQGACLEGPEAAGDSPGSLLAAYFWRAAQAQPSPRWAISVGPSSSAHPTGRARCVCEEHGTGIFFQSCCTQERFSGMITFPVNAQWIPACFGLHFRSDQWCPDHLSSWVTGYRSVFFEEMSVHFKNWVVMS